MGHRISKVYTKTGDDGLSGWPTAHACPKVTPL